MHVLVTGGAGFIGAHVVDHLLEAGHRVRVLDSLDAQVHEGQEQSLSTDAELVVGDVRDRDVVRRSLHDVDRVLHLAAAVGVGQSMYEIERYTSVNAVGAAVLLEEVIAVRDRVAKVAVASSMSIYGEGQYRCPREQRLVSHARRSAEQLAARSWEPTCPACGEELEAVATPEQKALEPASIYAIGKRDHEEMFLCCGRAYGIPTTALRFFNTYGERQSLSNPYTGVAAIFATRLLNGAAPIVFEDGLQSRDFVHVSDVARAVAAALDPDRADGEAVNIGTGRAVTVVSVAKILADALGVAAEPEIRNTYREGDIRHCFADATRAREALGWEARVELADGLRELSQWLSGREAVDRVEQATALLEQRGLAH